MARNDVHDSPIPFTELVAVEKLGNKPDTFMNKLPPWCPGVSPAAYGGHVYAQAVWAASQTVGKGMVVHSVHGYFTLPGLVDRPFIYDVQHTSEGRSFCTRTVTVRQPLSASPTQSTRHPFNSSSLEGQELGEICFTSISSFKRDEERGDFYQTPRDVFKEYRSVLEGKRPDEHRIAPTTDTPMFGPPNDPCPPGFTPFPGMSIRTVDMTPYLALNSTVSPHTCPPATFRPSVLSPVIRSRTSPSQSTTPPSISHSSLHSSLSPHTARKLSLYTPHGALPPVPTNPNMHACAHLYASDRNSLFIISNSLGYGNHVAKMGSLSHSVIFHTSSPLFAFQAFDSQEQEAERNGYGDEGKEGKGSKWFLQEAWTSRAEGGRGMHESWIFNEEGVHVASTWQEGLVRGQREKRGNKL